MFLAQTQQNKNYFSEKFFSYGVAGLFILLLVPYNVGIAYLILGHAHFMMTSLYQYKAGRITPFKFIVYLVAFCFVFTVAHAFPNAFTLFAAGFLIVHICSGEIRHLKKKYSMPYALVTFALMTLLCSWLAVELWGVGISVFNLTIILNLIVFVAAYSLFKKVPFRQIDPFFYTLLCVYMFFLMLEYLGFRPDSYESFGFLVIAHYFTTYFNVTKSFHSKSSQKAKVFILESVGMNLLFLSGFILVVYYIGTNNLFYDAVYHPISFYVWTVMHFLTTWDNNEYKYILMPANRKEYGGF